MNGVNYYTYAYLREDKTPYYIGKGKGDRVYSTNGRTTNLPKDKSRIIFLKQNLTEEEAFKHEVYMIAVFGRKDNGTGILRNKTDGGDGISGYIHSEETRRKISASMTPEQRSERSRKASASMTPEQRSEVAKKRDVNMTPEQRSERSRRAQASRTPEQRSELAKKRQANKTPEQRSEESRKGRESMTPEQRSELVRKGRANMTPERRSEIARKGRASMTPEQRREIIKKANAALTPEKRRENIAKANLHRWQCTETGFISNAGNLAQYQKRRGIDTSKRVRLDQ